MARQTGQKEAEKTRHLFHKLLVLLTKGNSCLFLNRDSPLTLAQTLMVSMALWVRSGAGQCLWCGAVIEVVTVLFKHGYHRAGVAIARSRLDQDCELVREVIASWAGQS